MILQNAILHKHFTKLAITLLYHFYKKSRLSFFKIIIIFLHGISEDRRINVRFLKLRFILKKAGLTLLSAFLSEVKIVLSNT